MYDPAVITRLFLATAFLGLTACAPLAIPQDNNNAASSALPIDTATGELDITPEPFVDPLLPVSMTGGTTIQERTLSGGTLQIGSSRARLTMDLFLNLQSPYSKEFIRSRMPILLTKFVETGDMNIRIYLLPIEKYDLSEVGARYLACAASFGKGYPALTRMAEKEFPGLDTGDVDEMDIDGHEFTVCNTDTTRDVLSMPRSAAAKLGVTLVPTYVIEGKPFVGLPTEADLIGAINAAL